MGTNYYVKSTECECCGHKPEPLHIGKSSAGWTFSFHATKDIRSYKQWCEYLKDKVIEDEYGREVSLEWFKDQVYAKRLGLNHTEEMHRQGEYNYDFFDGEGHSFTDCDFC